VRISASGINDASTDSGFIKTPIKQTNCLNLVEQRINVCKAQASMERISVTSNYRCLNAPSLVYGVNTIGIAVKMRHVLRFCLYVGTSVTVVHSLHTKYQ